MAWKKKPELTPEQLHQQAIRTVVSRHPNFEDSTRWVLEIAFLDAAYLYDNVTNYEYMMPDYVWDDLGAYLAKTWNKRSPYFKGCVDRNVLRRKATNLSINWNHSLGQATAEFWAAIADPPPEPPKPKLKLRKIVKGPTKVRKLRLVRSV